VVDADDLARIDPFDRAFASGAVREEQREQARGPQFARARDDLSDAT
jgi:hypothetical protein